MSTLIWPIISTIISVHLVEIVISATEIMWYLAYIYLAVYSVGLYIY